MQWGRQDPIDRNGHGTHCAGVIAASTNNNVGIAGIAGLANANVKLMAVKGLSDYGSGQFSWLMQGLDYAIKKGAKISSNSWGGGSGGNDFLRSILDNVPDHLFVAAAGNEGSILTSDSSTCGANAKNQICVGSTTEDDDMSSFSNYGKPYVHVMAPGSDIASTYPDNSYVYLSGTSMACPQVSGLAALVRSVNGDLTAAEVKQLIENNVQRKSQYANVCTTEGLIDVQRSLQAATRRRA